MSIPTLAVIITAAGSSSRFSKELDESVKKEYLSIDGHTVLYRAAKPFFEIPTLSAVIVTCPEGSEDETAVALEDLIDIAAIPIVIVKGGKTRKESVENALNRLKDLPTSFEYIAIHDGARPFLDKRLIINTFAAATVAGGAVPALPLTDAVKRIGADGMFEESIDKKTIFTVQTPQIFRRDELFDAYERYKGDEADDDAAVFIKAGYKCTFALGDRKNKKITYLEDIPDAARQAQEYIAAREEGRRSAKASKRMRELMMQGAEQ